MKDECANIALANDGVGINPPAFVGTDFGLRRRVAEISKNWPESEYDKGEIWLPLPDGRKILARTLSDRFEVAIEANRQLGYRLVDWQLSRVVTGTGDQQVINETIIAVFSEG